MTIELLYADTYMAAIRGSVGSHAYQHAYGLVDGVRKDLVHGGEYSCAFFVSVILLASKLLKEPHLRVQGTIKDLESSGWIDTNEPKPGDILVWEPIKESDGEDHFHIGFYLGEQRAISNSTSQRAPREHHWTFGTEAENTPTRAIVRVLTHPTFFADASYR